MKYIMKNKMLLLRISALLSKLFTLRGAFYNCIIDCNTYFFLYYNLTFTVQT